MRNDQPGFSEAAIRALEDIEANAPPPSAYEAALSRAEGRARGAARPHYFGHRQRLRDRFVAGEPGVLPEYEILELILFNAIPRVDVKPLAKELLAGFGDLNAVLAAPEAKLARFRPSGEVTRKIKYDAVVPKMLVQFRLASEIAARM
ncbi:MAG: hypothetical protein AAFU55_16770, partial [Pseudomonadota bacterium]